jgi:hypothetical protein
MFRRGLNVFRMEVYQTNHQKTPKPLMQLSLQHLLTQFGSLLQQRLFPRVEEEVGPLSKKHQHLITVLAVARIEPHLDAPRSGPGRPSHDRVALARAFVAKAVFDLPTTDLLIQLLGSDASLRRICGWESNTAVPDKSVFSRAFAAFAESALPQRIHEALILDTHQERLVGHISRDATAVLVRERVPTSARPVAEVAKATPPRRRKRGEPKPSEKMTRIERQQSMTLEAQRYKGRTACERVNGRLKDEFGGRFIRVRGHTKVMAHLMFGLIVLTVDQVLRLTS